MARLTNTHRVHGIKNKITISVHAFIRDCVYHIEGSNNKIVVADGCRLEGCEFFIKGNGVIIDIEQNVVIGKGSVLWVEDDNGSIKIGKNSTFESVHLAVTEDNKSIQIGEDCMFSTDIDVRTGDSHSIIDINTGNRINYARDVIIGNHVWCGAHSSILKGSIIPDDVIIGTRSVVTPPPLQIFAQYHHCRCAG